VQKLGEKPQCFSRDHFVHEAERQAKLLRGRPSEEQATRPIIHPGAILADELAAPNITPAALARHIAVPPWLAART
jgi:hypothetical protein